MSTRQIRNWILIIPTLTIGVWEYVRHTFLLPYISMGLGNLMGPVLVLLVTVTLLRKLFRRHEALQEDLNRERAEKTLLKERERIARELHDGIAQSLFLLSVKVDGLEKRQPAGADAGYFESLRKTVRQTDDYVRQSIASLRDSVRAPGDEAMQWKQSLKRLLTVLETETGIGTAMDWTLSDAWLTTKERVELYAIVREALQNVRKHAQASKVRLIGRDSPEGWLCRIQDDGKGLDAGPAAESGRYGMRIMKERAEAMGWTLGFVEGSGGACLEVRGGNNHES